MKRFSITLPTGTATAALLGGTLLLTLTGCHFRGNLDCRKATPCRQVCQTGKMDANGQWSQQFDLRKYTNFDFDDRVKDDPLDGWSCRVTDNDQRNYAMQHRVMTEVPFDVPDPYREPGVNTAVSFASPAFPNGIAELELIPSDAGERSDAPAFLYLLTTVVAPEKRIDDHAPLLSILVDCNNGEVREFPFEFNRQTGLMKNSKLPDILPERENACFFRSTHSQVCVFYVGKIPLHLPLGDIQKITLVSQRPEQGALLLAGATLASEEKNFQAITSHAITMNDSHQAIVYPEDMRTVPGSALDRSVFFEHHPITEADRLIVTPEGHFARSAEPEKPIRILSGVDGYENFYGRDELMLPQFDTHEMIADYVMELRRGGYNMNRPHGMDVQLGMNAAADGELNLEQLDKFDYLVYCMKENGIYLNLDGMVSNGGYRIIAPWGGIDTAHYKWDYKSRIYFDPVVRENWLKGVRSLLCHVNIYTQTRLIDDPVLAMIVGFNEQEYAFEDTYDSELAQPYFQEFLRKIYHNDIAKLREAWGEKYAGSVGGFEEIAFFSQDALRDPSNYGVDCAKFLRETESEIQQFFRDSLRKMGFRGAVTNFNVGKNFHYKIAHKYGDFVASNIYHAHPTVYIQKGSLVNQDGVAASANDFFRWAAMDRQADKPFLISEYAVCFWNRYRYEQGIAMPAYAAFQDWDGLTAFALPVAVTRPGNIFTFANNTDPVMRANEVLACLLFRRGDVRASEGRLRLLIDAEAVYDEGRQADGVDIALTPMALIAGFAGDVVAENEPLRPAQENEILFSATSSAREDWPQELPRRGELNRDKLLKVLQQKALVSADNPSRPEEGFFVTSTGELTLDVAAEQMLVNTPRTQALASPENPSEIVLDNLTIHEMTTRGTAAVAAIDGERTIGDAERLLLIYTTISYNDAMEFSDPWEFTLKGMKKGASLLKTGSLRFSVRNRYAETLKLYPLDVTGRRSGAAILPELVQGQSATFAIDTGKLENGPTVFFELISEQ